MGRIRKPFHREEKYLEARKIFVIAFEGAEDKAEDRYFKGIQNLANELCEPNKPRIHIKAIPNFENKSAPSYIFENLKKFKDDYNLDYNEEESFMLIDFDSHQANIENYDINNKCKDNNFHLLICNPCFELWLLLHFIDVANKDKNEKQKLSENKRESNSMRYIDTSLKTACGSSNKSNLNFNKYKNNIYTAIENAKKLETCINSLDDYQLKATAYIVVEKILNYCKIENL